MYSFLIAPLYFLSGIFFPIEQLWTPLRLLAEVFPLIHGVRMAQALFWNVEVTQTLALHGGIVLVQALVFGSIAYRVIRRKLVA